jgi:hypothetical protein
MKVVRGHLSYANLVATLAVFIGLGGSSYAALSLPQNSVGSKQLKRRAVTAAKIKDGAVTARKLNTAGVTVPRALHADSSNAAAHARTADSSLHAGTADTAARADSATNAAHATIADHASAADAVPALGFANLALKNGWVGNCAEDGVPAIAKSSEGVVYFRGGMCRRSGNSTNPFDVPAGFAPDQTEFITVDENLGATGRIEISSNGQVIVDDDPEHSGSAAGSTHLSGVSYTLPY